MNRQRGFAIMEVALVMAAVIMLGFVGYQYYRANLAVKESETVAITPSVVESTNQVPDAPELNNDQDLGVALTALEKINPEAGTQISAQLEADIGSF